MGALFVLLAYSDFNRRRVPDQLSTAATIGSAGTGPLEQSPLLSQGWGQLLDRIWKHNRSKLTIPITPSEVELGRFELGHPEH